MDLFQILNLEYPTSDAVWDNKYFVGLAVRFSAMEIGYGELGKTLTKLNNICKDLSVICTAVKSKNWVVVRSKKLHIISLPFLLHIATIPSPVLSLAL